MKQWYALYVFLYTYGMFTGVIQELQDSFAEPASFLSDGGGRNNVNPQSSAVIIWKAIVSVNVYIYDEAFSHTDDPIKATVYSYS